MKVRCPHCMQIISLKDNRGFFLTCTECNKRFRMNETNPVTVNQANRAVERQVMVATQAAAQSTTASPVGTLDKRAIARLNSKGVEYYRVGRYIDAERELRQSLKLDPEQPKVVRMLNEIERMRLGHR